nr:unnamed protein product [Spirometra erinaceieuropaei]
MDILGSNTSDSESLTKKRKLHSESSDLPAVPSPSSRDITMVAAVSVPPHELVCYLLRFLSPHARRLAFDAGLTPKSDFQKASEVLLQLFASPDASALANQRFATLRQRPGQSVDDFAHDLRRLAAAAFTNLPESDRDRFILHQFITGLRDRTASGVLLLHPPASLSSAIQQCRLYEECHSRATGSPRRTNSPTRTTPPPNRRPSTLPVRFPDHNPGCPYCAAFGPQARRCGHNQPSKSVFIAPTYLALSSHQPPFTISATLVGHKIQALVDTGANVSLVNNSSLTRELREQIDHTSAPHTLRAANGTLIPILGRITLDLTIDDTEVTYPFLVTSDSPWALVLGLDLLVDHDCVIHTKSRRLSILTRPDPPTHIPSENLDLMYDAVVAAATLEPSDIDANLPPTEVVGPDNRNKLRKLLLSFPGLFTWSTDTIGRTRKVQHTINTGDAKPIWQPPRRIPVRFRAEVDKIIDELLKAHIIQPSSSPWASPIALVPKKDGSLRLCIDYRRLNAVTVRDSFPLPRLDDTLDSLGGAAWFSTLDLKSGYWQVEIDPKDRPKTAFIVPQGLFEFQTLPFGLCNAAATFQRLMYQVLRHLIPHKCLVYLDDIIVFGPDVEQHNRNLREVLEALRDAGLTLNPAKCTFLRPEDVCRTLDVNKTRTTPYHPEGNGLVERTNRTLHNLLLAFCKDNHEHDWDTQLPFCLMAYRSSIHSSTGFTPHYLWTGRDLRLPVDLQHTLDVPDPTPVTTYASQLRETIRTAYNAARETLGASSNLQKTQCDRRSPGTTHQIGDLVMHHNPIPPRGVSAKFHYPWQGPFVILDAPSPTTYLLRDASQPHAPPFTTNFNKLKPYRGRLPTCTPDSLPIIPYDQVPPAAVEVTIPSPIIPNSNEDSAASSEGGYVRPQQN